MRALYSQRLPWSAPYNHFSERKLALERAGVPLRDLSVSNPTRAGLAYPHQQIQEAFSSVRDFTYEPDPAGSHHAREAIAAYYAERGVDVNVNRIVLTASTSEAYGYLLKLLCEPGDDVLVPVPSYPLFEHLAWAEGVRTAPYHLRYDGAWHLDPKSLVDKISTRTRAAIAVSPNNPTGSVLKLEEVAMLQGIAAEYEFPLIVDEVFLDYRLAGARKAVTSLAGESNVLAFSLNGLSKSAAMPQVKLGWIVVSGPAAEVNRAVERLELIADNYLSVGTPVQNAAGKLFATGAITRQQIQQRLTENYEMLGSLLRGSPAGALHAEGGWSAIVQVPRTRTEEEWVLALLEEKHTIAQPGYFFDMGREAFLVVSLLTEPEIFAEGISRLRHLVDKSA